MVLAGGIRDPLGTCSSCFPYVILSLYNDWGKAKAKNMKMARSLEIVCMH